MKCANCPYFKILHMPLHDDDAIYYFGKAKCNESLVKTLMNESGRNPRMIANFREKAIDLMEL